MKKKKGHLPATGEFLLYTTADGRIRIETRMQNETVWLNQKQLAELFQTSVPNINMHIKNIFDEGELSPEATVQDFLTVRKEGSREVQRNLAFYNLDLIISVGYRIKSHVATHFRQWATQRLREYIIKGFAMDDERHVPTPQSGDAPSGRLYRYLAGFIRNVETCRWHVSVQVLT